MPGHRGLAVTSPCARTSSPDSWDADDFTGGAIGFHIAVGVDNLAERKRSIEVETVASALGAVDNRLEDGAVAGAVDDAALEALELEAESRRRCTCAINVPVGAQEAGQACASAGPHSRERVAATRPSSMIA